MPRRMRFCMLRQRIASCPSFLLRGVSHDRAQARRALSASRPEGARSDPRERLPRLPAQAPGAADLLSRARPRVRGRDRSRLEHEGHRLGPRRLRDAVQGSSRLRGEVRGQDRRELIGRPQALRPGWFRPSFLWPPVEPYVRFSRIRLTDGLLMPHALLRGSELSLAAYEGGGRSRNACEAIAGG